MAPGFAIQVYDRARDSNAAPSDSKDMRGKCNKTFQEVTIMQKSSKAKPPRCAHSILRSEITYQSLIQLEEAITVVEDTSELFLSVVP